MSEITILKLRDNIIVPLQTELHDRSARDLQASILEKIAATGAKGLLIDISGISIVDTFMGRLLGETAKMAALLGAETVLVGMRKEVVITLIQLGMPLKNLHTALSIEDGLKRLEILKRSRGINKGGTSR